MSDNLGYKKKVLIAKHIRAITSLLNIEENLSNKDTPDRIAKMYCDEIFRTRNNQGIEELNSIIKLFPAENNNPVTVEVPFYSMCEHHWLPFMGTFSITYIPDKTIIGFSKIPRIVKFFSQRPQVQERLTNDVGEYLVKCLKPKELSIRVSAEHTCVTMRGVESPCKTITIFGYTNGEPHYEVKKED